MSEIIFVFKQNLSSLSKNVYILTIFSSLYYTILIFCLIEIIYCLNKIYNCIIYLNSIQK